LLPTWPCAVTVQVRQQAVLRDLHAALRVLDLVLRRLQIEPVADRQLRDLVSCTSGR
jgi:hypothetical protein